MATHNDQQSLASLIHFETYVHRHLDYRPPLECVGLQPFHVIEQQGEIMAALACPPDPPDIAWLRLFAASYRISPEKAWQILWSEAHENLTNMQGVKLAAAIPIYSWFENLLKKHGFEQAHRIVLLSWEGSQFPDPAKSPLYTIRPMNLDDLANVQKVDNAAFVPLWKNSRNYLEIAFRQSVVATVATNEDQMLGYQISTATPMGGHLARLAVLPEMQGLGIGQALLHDLLTHFQRRGARKVSVNTQDYNQASLALYNKMGFHPTGETFPIYQKAV